MELTTVQQVLVIMLSSALAILLVLAIIAGILFIKFLNSVRKVTTGAEKVVESAQAVSEVFKNAAGPTSAIFAIKSIVQAVTSKPKQSNKKEN